MTATPLRIDIYSRQSEASDRSIDSQLALGRERAAEEGWTIAWEGKDGVSASRHGRAARTDWPTLLARIEGSESDGFWLWESSRGDRTLSTWAAMLEQCQKHGKLIFVETHERMLDVRRPSDWKVLANEGVDNAYESDKTSQRVRRDVKTMAAAGRPHGRVLYGYRREYAIGKSPKGRPVKVITGQYEEPAEAAIVKEVIGSFARCEPVKGVRDRLNARGDYPRSGKPWTDTSIRNLALNPAYIGKRIHVPGRSGGRFDAEMLLTATLHEAMWDAIVDEETFYAAQRFLLNPARATWRDGRPGASKHLLTNIAQCGVCGSPMQPGYYPERLGAVAIYKCRDRRCVTFPMADVDSHVMAKLFKALSEESALARIARAQADGGDALKAARAALTGAEAEYTKLKAMHKARKISLDAFAEFEPDAIAAVAEARAKVNELAVPPEMRGILDGPAAEIAARFGEAPLAAQRSLIRYLTTGIYIDRSPVRGHRVPADQRVRVDLIGGPLRAS